MGLVPNLEIPSISVTPQMISHLCSQPNSFTWACLAVQDIMRWVPLFNAREITVGQERGEWQGAWLTDTKSTIGKSV